MSNSDSSLLNLQINRAYRRLFAQVLVNRAIGCLSGSLAAALIWFLLEPFLLEQPAAWLRWAVAGSIVVGGMALAAVLAWRGRPSQLAAALSLDEKFGLKERITTSLSLTPEQQATPAGEALLDDVRQRLAPLDVASRFPIRLSWFASLVPTAAALLALVAVFYEPPKGPAKANAALDMKKPPANKAEIDKKMEQLRAKKRTLEFAERPKSEKLQEIEADMEKIANKPRGSREQVRERAKEISALQEKAKERKKELADKSRSLKQQLKEMNRQSQQQQSQDGPAKDLQKALAEGNFEKAQEEAEKLAKKLREGQLGDEAKKQLEKQLDDLKDKLKKAADLKNKEDKLKQMAKEGKIDAETLQREMKELAKQKEKLQDLKKLANKLDQCQKCMEKGDMAGAADNLQQAADGLKQMDLGEKEMEDLQDQLQKLQDAKDAAMKGDKPGQQPGQQPGDGDGDLQKDGDDGQDGDGQDGEEPGNGQQKGSKTKTPGKRGGGGGKRPKAQKESVNHFNARQRTDFDPKGQKILDGFAPGQNYRSKNTAEIAGDVKQAAQEAPEAIEQQRIPKAARDMAKGYFHNLGGQFDKEKPPAGK